MMTRRGIGTGALVAGLGALAAACSPVTLFNQIAVVRSNARIQRGVTYRDGPRGALDIYRPREDAPGGHPVVVFYYGGGWNSGERSIYAFVGAAMAAQGFLTIIPDYRVVPEVRFPDFLKDNADALAWVVKHVGEHGGDAGRLAVMGHSAGGYNAMMLALDPQWARGAGADPAVIRAVVGLSGPYDFYPFDVKASQDAFSQWPEPAQTQPITFARKDAPAVFVGHGVTDVTVRPRNAKALAARLRNEGAPVVEEHYYEKIGHADLIKAMSFPFVNTAPVLADVTAFLRANGVA